MTKTTTTTVRINGHAVDCIDYNIERSVGSDVLYGIGGVPPPGPTTGKFTLNGTPYIDSADTLSPA